MGLKINHRRHRAQGRGLAAALLPCAITLALAACGGGGRGVRSTPPATTPPPSSGLGFTPNVGNDSSVVVNPPTVASVPAPLSFDPQLGIQLQVINAGASLAAGARGAGVGIGILDSGVRTTHPELSPRVTYNGFYLDSPPNNPNVDYVLEHGTWVALTAAGSSVGRWPGGVAPAATIISGRFLSDDPPTDDGSGQGNGVSTTDAAGFGGFLAEAQADLYSHGARIINNSWGGVYFEDEAAGAAAMAVGYTDFILDKGGLVVFANGNYGTDSRYRADPSDTSSLPTLAPSFGLERGWLTVAALDPDNPTQLLPFSQYCGRAMNYCLSAPGAVWVVGASPVGTTTPDATTEDKAYRVQGTSFSAPLVSGAAAAVWSMFPYFSNDLVRQTLLATAKDVGAPGVDAVFGWGVLDVGKAVNGPANFAWGDVSVSFSGNSVWRNQIVGSGGLTKSGSGILTLVEQARYTGDTRVQAGGLSIQGGLGDPNAPVTNLVISQGATVWAKGGIYSNIVNSGNYYSGVTSIRGDYTQTATGNLGVWLSSTITDISGKATIDGQLTVLGAWQGYTTNSKQLLFQALGGVTGTFSRLRAAPNVFLEASLSYEPSAVYLDIVRINTQKAVTGMGLGDVAVASAARVESAMTAIDGQLAGLAPAAIAGSFIDAAGDLQQSSSIANADVSLRSLSGELHAASAAMTFDGIDAGRRALDARIEALAHSRNAVGDVGGWYRDLSSSGTLAQSGFDSIGLDASGEMIGNDVRVGEDSVVGIGMNRIDQSSWLGALGDRSRGRQREMQLYAATWEGDWYGHAQLALGAFDRQMQRNLLLGSRQDAVATQLSGHYASASGEIGRRFEGARGIAVTPYLGSQFVRIGNDGFAEASETGFGLRAKAWDSSRWQGFAGLRADRGWRIGDIGLRADARVEWQQALASRGQVFDASFTGLSQWAPLQGIVTGGRSHVFGLGMSANAGGNTMVRFDLSRRSGASGASTMASLQATCRF